MKIPDWSCADFEAAVSDYRDGILRLELAQAARQHVNTCAACAELNAAVGEALAQVRALPQLDPSPRVMANILAQAHAAHAQAPVPESGGGWSMAALWASFSSPRFAMALAMSVFAVSLLLNAAQINLRQVSVAQLSPANLSGVLERQVQRAWARGVSYYHDLRVVYEIEAAVHQMRQTNPPAPSQPAGHAHTQAIPPNAPTAVATLLVHSSVLPVRYFLPASARRPSESL